MRSFITAMQAATIAGVMGLSRPLASDASAGGFASLTNTETGVTTTSVANPDGTHTVTTSSNGRTSVPAPMVLCTNCDPNPSWSEEFEDWDDPDDWGEAGAAADDNIEIVSVSSGRCDNGCSLAPGEDDSDWSEDFEEWGDDDWDDSEDTETGAADDETDDGDVLVIDEDDLPKGYYWDPETGEGFYWDPETGWTEDTETGAADDEDDSEDTETGSYGDINPIPTQLTDPDIELSGSEVVGLGGYDSPTPIQLTDLDMVPEPYYSPAHFDPLADHDYCIGCDVEEIEAIKDAEDHDMRCSACLDDKYHPEDDEDGFLHDGYYSDEGDSEDTEPGALNPAPQERAVQNATTVAIQSAVAAATQNDAMQAARAGAHAGAGADQPRVSVPRVTLVVRMR